MKSPSPSLGGKRILVVDDEPNLRLLLSEFFEGHGALVTTAENGFEVVELVPKDVRLFDAIVLDVIMPVMDGVTACRNLRNQGILMPIIFTSGYAESDEIYKLRQDRSIYFVQKPYKTDLLLDVVVNAVKTAK